MNATKANTQKTTHLTHEYGAPSLCGAIRETNETNSTEDAPDVTCKRCLARLDQLTAQATSQNPVVDEDDFPDPPASDTPASRANMVISTKELDRIDDKAGRTNLKDKARTASATKPAKAPAPKNVHLSHEQGEPLKNGDPAPQSLCRIPGPTTTDPDAVTCKVCLAKLHGQKPGNAIPDEVKTARKAFRSFIARATYMAYMDGDQLGTSWTLCHTNLAGERYQITSPGCEGGIYLCNDTMAGNTKESLIATIEQLGWSCGEE